jgi:hypothetical protein
MSLELHLVELGVNATDTNLTEQMRHMENRRKAGFRRIGCLIRGYEHDERALWQIPEVVALCKRLVRIGFISGLDVSFTLPKPVPLPVPVEPFGALDVWVIARGSMSVGGVEVTRDLLDQFKKDLCYANTVAEDLLSEE